jgi:CheY-like chemotaxis protein/anti-sigma regulatory factor (Ser/Thr protein kinase)
MAFGRVQELRAQTIDAAARLRAARALFNGALPANVRLDYELEPGLWPVTVDPAQLELAILNLVLNARDAMPRGGRIVLTARNEGDRVVIGVIDDGEGMSEEVKARALEPFYTTKGVGKGSGMGLPQAYGFARQHGGTLTLESRQGGGTTVKLFLPRARGAVAEEPAVALGRPAEGVGKVLLVEDDAEVRDTVGAALRAAGFEIHTANMADEALERLIAGERYDVVLTDVVMPGALNGVDLAREVKRRYPRTAVVMATGYSDRAVQVAGVQALPKPYNLEQVVEALNAAMRLQQL